jgi:hypothetical protein
MLFIGSHPTWSKDREELYTTGGLCSQSHQSPWWWGRRPSLKRRPVLVCWRGLQPEKILLTVSKRFNEVSLIWRSHATITVFRGPLSLFVSADQTTRRSLERYILADLIHFLHILWVYLGISTWRQVWKMNPVKMMEKRKSSNLIIVELPWRNANLHQSAWRLMRVAQTICE